MFNRKHIFKGSIFRCCVSSRKLYNFEEILWTSEPEKSHNPLQDALTYYTVVFMVHAKCRRISPKKLQSWFFRIKGNDSGQNSKTHPKTCRIFLSEWNFYGILRPGFWHSTSAWWILRSVSWPRNQSPLLLHSLKIVKNGLKLTFPTASPGSLESKNLMLEPQQEIQNHNHTWESLVASLTTPDGLAS